MIASVVKDTTRDTRRRTMPATTTKSIAQQLYDRYLDSDIVQDTEDSLTKRDIQEVIDDLGVTKERWNEDKHLRSYFWKRVNEKHYFAL